MAKTIDDLGPDASQQYAEGQYLLERDHLELPRIPPRIQIDVTRPTPLSEFDQKYTIEKKVQWADFPPPAGFFEQKGRLFTDLVAPRLGSLEMRDNLQQKLEQMGISGNGDTVQKEKRQLERKILLSLLSRLKSMDQMLIDINTKCNQYHKG